MDEQKDQTLIASSVSTQTTETRIDAEATCDSTNIENQKGFLARSVDAVFEWVASRPAGQILFRSTDRVLRLVEKTLVWSTQPRKVDEHNVEGGVGVVLVSRPLAWPLFLPLLLVLRVVRTTLYVVTLGSADSQALIHWLQCRRRRMRAIKFAGIRNMRSRCAQTCKWTWGPFSALGWFLGLTGDSAPSIEVHEEGVLTSPSDKEKKRKYAEVEQSDWSEDSDVEGKFCQKLDKYLNRTYNSDSDPDFEPGSEEESSDDEGVLGEEEERLLQEETANVGPANVSVSGNGVIGASSDIMATEGEFKGSPTPMAAIPSERTSRVVRFFVPFKRRSSK